MRLAPSFAAALLLSPLVAQAAAPFAVGVHHTRWPNASGLGTATLDVHLCYPSPTGGRDAPIEASPAGWPVIVLLHGYGLLGRDYVELGEAWAKHGFAVVLLDTAPWNYVDQTADGIAVFDAIATANATPGSFIAGAFDVARMALAGHSMGGGTLGLVLAVNPGYRCGLALAPVSPGAVVASRIAVPFGIVVGAGDTITPWQAFSRPYFDAASPRQGLKLLSVLGAQCDHLNLAGFSGPQDPAFRRVVDLGVGFFRHFLLADADATALERCLGPIAQHAPAIALHLQVVQPRVWAAARPRLGRTVRVSVAAEEGVCGVLVGPGLARPVATPLGTLLLDPLHVSTFARGVATRDRRFDAFLTVPNDPTLVGSEIALQAIGPTPTSPLQLGAAATLTVDQ